MSGQLSMGFAPPAEKPHRLWRRRDHDSSVASGQHAERTFAPRHEDRIVACLREERGSLTAAEVAQRIGLEHVQVARRLAAMEQRGMVKSIRPRGCRVRWCKA